MSENTENHALQTGCLKRIAESTRCLFERLSDSAAELVADDFSTNGFSVKRNKALPSFLIGTALGALSTLAVFHWTVPSAKELETAQLIEERVAETPSLTPTAEINLPLSPAEAPESAEEQTAETPEAEEAPVPDSLEKFEVKPRESLAVVLRRAGLTNQESYQITTALSDVLNLKQVQIGDTVEVGTTKDNDGNSHLLSVTLEDRHGNRYTAARGVDDAFEASMLPPEVTLKAEIASGDIDGAFVVNAKQSGIPTNVISQIIWAFDGPIDFTRDLRKGDSFTAVFNKEYNKNNEPTGNGELLYAALNLKTTGTHERYRYTDSKGHEDFYDDKGKIARKLFVMHPLKNPRITSRFGQRKHPILGYKLMHWGVDFGAPIGTPIRAPGEGTVTQSGRRGSYGRYVQIKHNSEYSSAYAHMSRIDDKIYVGKRVKAGEVIGYVGNTGRSTGPHLHWELIKNGQKINPTTQQITAQRKLVGTELSLFLDARNQMREKMTDETAYAKAEALPESRKMAYQEPKKVKKAKSARKPKTQKTAYRRTKSPRV
ncbi:MAG TPA: hypothetical protein DD624_03425 [Alphaproteobacteria bacterium]|nr:hypothetical protein [Alphaproteobacteria bacterium]